MLTAAGPGHAPCCSQPLTRRPPRPLRCHGRASSVDAGKDELVNARYSVAPAPSVPHDTVKTYDRASRAPPFAAPDLSRESAAATRRRPEASTRRRRRSAQPLGVAAAGSALRATLCASLWFPAQSVAPGGAPRPPCTRVCAVVSTKRIPRWHQVSSSRVLVLHEKTPRPRKPRAPRREAAASGTAGTEGQTLVLLCLVSRTSMISGPKPDWDPSPRQQRLGRPPPPGAARHPQGPPHAPAPARGESFAFLGTQ